MSAKDLQELFYDVFLFIFVLLTINMVFNSVSDGAAQREVISFHALLLTLNWTLEFRTGVI